MVLSVPLLYALSFRAWQFLHKSHALSLLHLAAITSSRPSPLLPSTLQKAHPKIHVQLPNLDQCLYYLTHTAWALRSPSTSCPMPGPSNFFLPALCLRVYPHMLPPGLPFFFQFPHVNNQCFLLPKLGSFLL